MISRQKWGLAGLLAFEAIVAAYLFGLGASLDFVVSYALGAIVLAVALFTRVQRWQFAALAVFAAYRAYVQTASGSVAWGTWPTWLVPIGFAALAIAPQKMPRLGIAAIALARTWFILWYFPGLLRAGGAWELVAANALGAAGAWLWASAAESRTDALSSESRATG